MGAPVVLLCISWNYYAKSIAKVNYLINFAGVIYKSHENNKENKNI